MRLTSKTLFAVAGPALIVTACASAASGGETVPIRSDFGLSFSPMYTAFDGVHDFRVPVVPVAAPSSDLVVDSWEVVDSNGVLQKDVADIFADDPSGGATLRTRKAGDYIVIAHAGDKIGCSELHIALGTPEQWSIGDALYHDPRMLSAKPTDLPDPVDLPDNTSCDGCHGAGSMYLDVVHTPQQTGGFSDAWFSSLFTMGTRLRSSGPPPTVPVCLPYEWSITEGIPLVVLRQFHVGDASQEELAGLLLYLRSLPLMTQGSFDFGGAWRAPADK
jgi:hypothetical protein